MDTVNAAAQLNPTAKNTGAAIRKFTRSGEAYELLDRGPGGTWTAGGCALLAAALSKAGIGILTVLDGSGHGSDLRKAQHWLVQVPGGYIDADGFSTGAELLRRWKNDELVADGELRAPKPADFRSESWQPALNKALVDELAAKLKLVLKLT